MADRNEYVLPSTDFEEAVRSAIAQMHRMADDHLRDYLAARGLILATPEHDAAVAARALREAAESMRRHKDPGHWNLRGEADPDLAASPDVWIEWRADRIERAGG